MILKIRNNEFSITDETVQHDLNKITVQSFSSEANRSINIKTLDKVKTERESQLREPRDHNIIVIFIKNVSRKSELRFKCNLNFQLNIELKIFYENFGRCAQLP